jgi:hypothetical protein
MALPVAQFEGAFFTTATLVDFTFTEFPYLVFTEFPGFRFAALADLDFCHFGGLGFAKSPDFDFAALADLGFCRFGGLGFSALPDFGSATFFPLVLPPAAASSAATGFHRHLAPFPSARLPL